MQVYQVYYDDKSAKGLRYGFIPHYQKNCPHNYENDILLDIWKSRSWVDAKMVGVLSWRLHEKTLLETIAFDKNITIFATIGYEKYEHPFSRKCFGSVNAMVDLADKHKLFPFKLRDIKVKEIVWCNYWLATPKIFDEYCTEYLSKTVEFFKGTELYYAKEKHRGKDVFAMTFFLEGLFSVFLTKKKYDYKKLHA